MKLTEIELYFLSRHMTRVSSCEWAVVYLGIGNGERFRYLRDEFFPDLTVIAFDPFEDGPNYIADTDAAARNSECWNQDGTKFIFHMRCFELEKDIDVVNNFAEGRQMLIISDIRGCALKEDGCSL